jgi:outer membrane protein assembly factor BamB
MININKSLSLLILCTVLGACSKLDDYMLGKDNTPSPKPLAPVASKVSLKESWSVPAGTSKKGSTFLKLKPVVMGNIVYTADAGGVVQAVDKTNGASIWSKKISEGVISGPSVSQGYVIIGTDSSHVIALKQADGTELWRSSVSADALSKPVIVGNKVLSKTIDGNLYAFELGTGKQLWVSEHGAPGLILKASSSPVIIDNKIALVGYSDGKLDAVDIQSGQVLWQRGIAYAAGASDVERLVDIDADPIVQGDVVFLASYQGYLGAFSLSSGQFVWKKPASTYTNIVANGNTLYMSDSNDVVWSINKQNGQVNWKQTKLKARGLTEPVLMGNRLIVGDKTGMLHVLSSQTGEFLSRTQLGGAITETPSVADNHVFVMTANGKLSRFSVS